MKTLTYFMLAMAMCGAAFAQSHQAAMLDRPNNFTGNNTFGSAGFTNNVFPISIASGFNIYGNNNLLFLENPASFGFGWALCILDEAPDYPVGFNYTDIPGWALKLYPDGRLSADGVISSGGHPTSRWRGQATSDPTSPRGGDQYHNTATGKVRIYNGSAWMDLN